MARIVHGAYTTVAASLAGLATDSTLVNGRAVGNVDSSGGALDYQWSGYFAVGSCAGNRKVEIWSYAMINTSKFHAGASGGGLVDVSGVKDTLKFIDSIPITTTACAVYDFGPYSIAKAYDGFPPARHGLIFVHNTGDPLSVAATAHMVGYRTVEVSSA